MKNSGNRLTFKIKCAYGFGDAGISLTCSMISVLFAIFLTDVVGLRPALASICIFSGRIWDFLGTPIVGYLVDRTWTKWGRYRPYLLFGALPFGISFIFIWWIPPTNSQIALCLYYSVVFFLFEAVMSLVFIPYVSLTPQISTNYDDRTTLTSYRMMFSLVGTLVAYVVPLAIIGDFSPGNADRILLIGFVTAIVASLQLLLTFFGIKENTTFVQGKKHVTILKSLKAVLKNRPYQYAVLMYLAFTTALDIISGMTIYFYNYVLGIDRGVNILLGVIYMTSLFAIPLWSAVSRKLDKTRVFIIAMIGMAAAMTAVSLLNKGTAMQTIYIIVILYGIFLAAGKTIPWAIIPDTVDYDEYYTGQRNEGILYAIMNSVKGLTTSIALPVMLLFLDMSGYVANVQTQSKETDHMIRLLFGGVPVLLFMISILFALLYPLNRKNFKKIKCYLENKKDISL